MKITFSKLNTNQSDIEVELDKFKSIYYDVNSVRTNGAEIDPKVFTNLNKVRLGTSKTKLSLTENIIDAFSELRKYAEYIEVSLNSLSEYLIAKETNTYLTPYKIKIIDLPETLTGGSSSTNYSVIQNALKSNNTKYVSLLLSDSLKSIGSSAFENCTNITSIVIPSSVTSIGENAFSSCMGLSTIIIPNTIKSMGKLAFNYCSELVSITIPNIITTINPYTFRYCKKLESVVIPDSVVSIGAESFLGCTKLMTINYTGTQVQWNSVTFGNEWNTSVPSDCIINYNYQN